MINHYHRYKDFYTFSDEDNMVLFFSRFKRTILCWYNKHIIKYFAQLPDSQCWRTGKNITSTSCTGSLVLTFEQTAFLLPAFVFPLTPPVLLESPVLARLSSCFSDDPDDIRASSSTCNHVYMSQQNKFRFHLIITI